MSNQQADADRARKKKREAWLYYLLAWISFIVGIVLAYAMFERNTVDSMTLLIPIVLCLYVAPVLLIAGWLTLRIWMDTGIDP